MNSLEELDSFTLNYYRNPHRRGLLEAFEYAARSLPENRAADQHELGMTLYFFARLARQDSTLAWDYESVGSRLEAETARDFVDKVLWLAAGERGSPPEPLPPHVPLQFDVLDRPARTTFDLDYLWTEFSATGSANAVRRVLEVLAWPDRMRLRLERWLRESTGGVLNNLRRRRIARRIQSLTGIECDPDRGIIITKGDLDCWCVGGPNSERELAARFPAVRAALPFTLDDQEIASIAVKGAARWSALSLRPHHPTVDVVWREIIGEVPTLIMIRRSGPLVALTPLLLPGQPSRRAWLLVSGAALIVSGYAALKTLCPWLVAATIAAPLPFGVAGVAAFAVAAVVGGFRQAFGVMMALALLVPGIDAGGRPTTRYMVGTVPPRWWFSISARLASLGVVGASSFFAASVAVGVLIGPVPPEAQGRWIFVFTAMLAARWVVSWVFSSKMVKAVV